MLNLGRICFLWLGCGCGATLIVILYGVIGIVIPVVATCIKNDVSDDDMDWVLKPVKDFGDEAKSYSILKIIGESILNVFALWPVNIVVKMQKLIDVRCNVMSRLYGAVYGTKHWCKGRNSIKESTEN